MPIHRGWPPWRGSPDRSTSDPLYIELMGEVAGASCSTPATDNTPSPFDGVPGSAAMEATLANTVNLATSPFCCRQGLLRSAPGGHGPAPRAEVHTSSGPGGSLHPGGKSKRRCCATSRRSWPSSMPKTSHGRLPADGGHRRALPSAHNGLLPASTPSLARRVPVYLDAMGRRDLAYSCSQEQAQLHPRLGPFSMGPAARPSWRKAPGQGCQLYLDGLPAQPILGQ